MNGFEGHGRVDGVMLKVRQLKRKIPLLADELKMTIVTKKIGIDVRRQEDYGDACRVKILGFALWVKWSIQKERLDSYVGNEDLVVIISDRKT